MVGIGAAGTFTCFTNFEEFFEWFSSQLCDCTEIDEASVGGKSAPARCGAEICYRD